MYRLQHLTLLIILCSNIDSKPQFRRRITAEDELIGSIFNTSIGNDNLPTGSPNRQQQRGINVIVTPEPVFQPTSSPQSFVTETGEDCVCVSYYLCDPVNNVVRSEDEIVDGFGIIDIRFNPDTCQDVLDVCCKGEHRQEEPIVPPPPPTRGGGCGIRNIGGLDFQLAGNSHNEAGFGEFPWTVALIRISDDECVCVGSLIHPKAILTGNHCVKQFIQDPKNLKIRAGEWDTQTTKERLPHQERIASRIFSHPKYNERSLAYDVAIIELEDPFQLDDHINTVCLPPPGITPSDDNCYATGWGKDVFGKEGKYSVIMKRIQLPIVPFNECQTALQKTRLTKKFQLDPSFICAGGVEGQDTCQGDGGAPLVCPLGSSTPNRYAQAGIVAWGIGCNEKHPAVYANVALAREWIDGQVRFIGLDTNYYTY